MQKIEPTNVHAIRIGPESLQLAGQFRANEALHRETAWSFLSCFLLNLIVLPGVTYCESNQRL